MYRRSTTIVLAKSVVDAMLSALTTVPGGALLTTPKVGLYSNNVTPTPTNAYADFTPATFHGYTAQTLTLSGPVNLLNGDQAMIGTVTFIATSGGSTNETEVGYYISDGVSAYYAGEQFATPVPFVNPGDFLDLDFIFPVLVKPPFGV